MNPASNAKLLSVEWTGASVLTFREPDRKTISKLRTLMAGMEIVSVRATQSPHKPCDATNSGSLEIVLAELERVLKQDYCDTLEDVKEWNGEFDYIVTTFTAHPGALHVLTRLSHPEKGGNIFYGRTIQRVSPDAYLMWVDD